ncbi:MAG: substrate-binding domain-containing protein [Candidatus Ruminococcus intestinipullorum]|nr:substrate-binding domain-containing protein [Candidatus Ruminococcus intestinipullorum]
MRKKWSLIVPATLCIAMTIGACAKTEEKPTFTGDKTEIPAYQGNLDVIIPAAYSNVADLNLEPGTYISILGKDKNSAYWKNVKKGVEQAEKDLNAALGYKGEDRIKITFNAPDGEDIDEQVNILDEELSRYPDVIGIASIDEDAYNVQFDSAAENGIPIIALDSGNQYHGIQCTIKTDNVEAARTGAYKLANSIQDEGELLLVVWDSNSETAKERMNGFLSEIQETYPNVSVVETIFCDKLEETKKMIAEEDETSEIKAESLSDEDVIEYYLEKHPNIKGIFGTNADATQLALLALQKNEKTEDIVLMGFDAGKEQLDALEKGEIQGLVVQNPFGIGYASVVGAARTVLQIGNEAVVDTGYVWVTPENMEEEQYQNMLYR